MNKIKYEAPEIETVQLEVGDIMFSSGLLEDGTLPEYAWESID